MRLSTSGIFLTIGAVYGAMSVALGAFAAHGLRAAVPPEMLTTFETAARYQMYHALALVFTAVMMEKSPQDGILAGAGWCFALGTLLFSGSLYLLVLLREQWLAIITPLGGLGFLAGWLLLAFAALSRK